MITKGKVSKHFVPNKNLGKSLFSHLWHFVMLHFEEEFDAAASEGWECAAARVTNDTDIFDAWCSRF